ncbi:MAG: DMT family transporter [Ilumatobacteraceae bacterium]
MLDDLARAFAGEQDLTERQGAALLAASGVVFSTTAIAYRAVDTATDWQFLAFRGASTTLAMLALVWARRRGRPVNFRGTTWRTVLAAFVLAITSMLYILALSRTSAATTLFMLASAPVFAAGFGWILMRERVQRTTMIAIGITLVGICVMVGSGLDAGSGLGVLFAALIPVTVGLYNVLTRADGGADPVVPALLAGAFLAVGSAAFGLVDGGLSISLHDGVLACFTGGFALGVGLPLFNLGHKSVAAARVSLLLLTEVVLAPLWVWIWPGETPRVGTLIGGAIVLAAVVWLITIAGEHEELLLT